MREIVFVIGNGFNYYARDYVSQNKREVQKMLLQRVKGKESVLTDRNEVSNEYENILKCFENSIKLFEDEEIENNKLKHMSIRTDAMKIPNLLLNSEFSFSNFIQDIEQVYKNNLEYSEKLILDLEDYLVRKKRKDIFDATIYWTKYKGKREKMFLNSSIRSIFKIKKHDSYHFFSYILAESLSPNFVTVLSTNYDSNVESVFSEKQYGIAYEKVEYRSIHGNFYTYPNYSKKIILKKLQRKVSMQNPKKSCEERANLIFDYNNEKIKNDELKTDDMGIILTDPNKKRSRMENLDTFSYLKNTIQKANIIVLFGFGMLSDPHITELLNKKKHTAFIIINRITEQEIKDYNVKSHNQWAYGFRDNFGNKIKVIDIYDGEKAINPGELVKRISDCVKEIILEKEKSK